VREKEYYKPACGVAALEQSLRDVDMTVAVTAVAEINTVFRDDAL